MMIAVPPVPEAPPGFKEPTSNTNLMKNPSKVILLTVSLAPLAISAVTEVRQMLSPAIVNIATCLPCARIVTLQSSHPKEKGSVNVSGVVCRKKC